MKGRFTGALVIAGLVVLTASPKGASASPMSFTHQGRLLGAAGGGISGTHDVAFQLFETPTGGSPVWSETDSLTLEDGRYTTILGDGSDLTGVIDGTSLYLQVTVDTEVLLPRQILVAVPYAVRAYESERVILDSETPCDSDHIGMLRWTGSELTLCVAPGDDQVVSLAPTADGSSSEQPGLSCLDILNEFPATTRQDALYWIDPNGGSTTDAYQAWCDMTTDNGGWTLVMNVAPADGNSVGFNNQTFWTSDLPFGLISSRFTNDFKSPAAYGLAASELMIQSVGTGGSGEIRGWRRWPMNSIRNFDSFFATGIPAVHSTDSCETGAASAVFLGTSDPADDILRQGSCLYADVNPSSSGAGDTIRLTTISGNSTDNKMSGFASCIDCGTNWQGSGRDYMGLDRAACSSASCAYNVVCRVGAGADCVGNYCGGTYSTSTCGTAWNSRFYVR
ncbi:MAG: hypothetical protein ACJAZO_001264 [Myxococcota bacterium]|jgi:hypothetical protein